MASKKEIRTFELEYLDVINEEFYTIYLRSDAPLPKVHAGQFVELLVENNKNVFLRRPFSIHDIDQGSNTLVLLIQIVGHGTKQLSLLEKGDKVNLIFPLGNWFTVSPDITKPLLIGGGCGVAPLLLLAKSFHQQGIKPDIIIGSRSKDYLLRVEEYEKYGNVYLTTENGETGEKGYVIHHSILWKSDKQYDMIYSCGPEVMLKAIAKYAGKKQTNCEVSLENMMACGIGACLCCVTETKEGNKTTCVEGPVFNTKTLAWEN